MRISKPKYREWKKHFDYRRWLRNNRKVLSGRKDTKERPFSFKRKVFKLPSNMSLINNFDEVVKCFDEIKYLCTRKKFQYEHVYLDMSNVTNITTDALMYLLVFVKNLGKYSERLKSICGNIPTDEKCKKIVKQSGFLKYLSSASATDYSDDNLQIYIGDAVDSVKIMEVCEFIHRKLGCDRIDTRKLYGAFGEIIGNSNEHAYSTHGIWGKWLLFSRYINGRVRIVVLDAGEGILETVKRKGLFENLDLADHKKLLNAAMQLGNNRSRTGRGYRNRGLPSIRANAINGTLKNFALFTNDVKYECNLSNGQVLENYTALNRTLSGTLYYFEYYLEAEQEL